ncbi:8-oxo-dGTP diphosphatase [Saccharothrix tamanrassetensis]|uniref:8-oxo-dGTP diphosphatase n=1 Tax=Saccharothrix tamanrassetensis TaxID=1051531 RepID=A0A841CLJ4_9PSEU|nr:NUDIX hydrolase [Saccharothrix tamanrassetensis]MBB5958421.1 8-oxo-dGTP diphosphatase [Saccharothrix tamanrassetensis]
MKDNNASITTDVLLFARDDAGQWRVLLIERGHDPFAGRWALPGGYVDPHETFAAAAVRELHEETGVAFEEWSLDQVGVYDTPDRDPRGRVMSVAFAAVLDHMPAAVGGDDARQARWWPVAEVMSTDFGALAFDHDQILTDAVELFMAQGITLAH